MKHSITFVLIAPTCNHADVILSFKLFVLLHWKYTQSVHVKNLQVYKSPSKVTLYTTQTTCTIIDGQVMYIWDSNQNDRLCNERRIYRDVHPFTKFFDFWLRSSRCEKDSLPVFSKSSQLSMVKIFHFQMSGRWFPWHPDGGDTDLWRHQCRIFMSFCSFWLQEVS